MILGIDRDKRNPAAFLLTCGRSFNQATKLDVNAEALSVLVHFLPLYLFRFFGSHIRRHLTPEGLLGLEDQYWDDATDSPCSRHTDSMREDHMDESDFVIMVSSTPLDDSLVGSKRPGSEHFLDFDDITQASFNTQGQAKVPRTDTTSRSGSPSRAALETLCNDQRNQLEELQARFNALLATSGGHQQHHSLPDGTRDLTK